MKYIIKTSFRDLLQNSTWILVVQYIDIGNIVYVQMLPLIAVGMDHSLEVQKQ